MKNAEDITQLGYHLNHAFTALVGELNHSLWQAGIPLNHSQFSILQALSRSKKGEMSQREIGDELGKDRAAISRALTYLENKGFISRRPVNGCKNGIFLTQKSKELKPLIEAAIKTATSKACSGMSEAEYEAGIVFLKKIFNALKPSIRP